VGPCCCCVCLCDCSWPVALDSQWIPLLFDPSKPDDSWIEGTTPLEGSVSNGCRFPDRFKSVAYALGSGCNSTVRLFHVPRIPTPFHSVLLMKSRDRKQGLYVKERKWSGVKRRNSCSISMKWKPGGQHKQKEIRNRSASQTGIMTSVSSTDESGRTETADQRQALAKQAWLPWPSTENSKQRPFAASVSSHVHLDVYCAGSVASHPSRLKREGVAEAVVCGSSCQRLVGAELLAAPFFCSGDPLFRKRLRGHVRPL
jgi:hypothetical protein